MLLAEDYVQGATATCQETPAREISLEQRQTLFRTGDRMRHIYRVKTGLLKTTRVNAENVEQISGFYAPGDTIGLDGSWLGAHQVSAAAIEKTVLEVIQWNETSLSKSTEMLKLMAREIHQNQTHLALLNKTRAESRLAAFLLHISGRLSPNPVYEQPWISISRADMACFLGLTHETISRLLKRFETENLLQLKWRRVRIAEHNRLQALGQV